jgi:hypothetical protein
MGARTHYHREYYRRRRLMGYPDKPGPRRVETRNEAERPVARPTVYRNGQEWELRWPEPVASVEGRGVTGGSLLCLRAEDERYRWTVNTLAASVPDTNGLQ